MFVDEVVVKLIAGKGGDGCTSFRREKFIAMGGPNGGNGGRGANIIFKTDKSLKTLLDLKMKKIIKGDKGVNGKGSDQNGANALDVIINVPEGTVVTNLKDGRLICDLIDGEAIIVHGGRGGKGNKAFATHNNPAPKMSELGAPGEELEVKCELKILADVGLVGFPSVGKSTLLSIISNASPKIGAYHFTTLSPNLGVVKIYDDSFVMADLPGLIEGASDGVGLGHKFLRHIERSKVIAHVIDMSASEGRNPINDYEAIIDELKKYDEKLLLRPFVVIANKMDIEGSKENLELFMKKYPNIDIFPISAVLNEGIDKLIIKLNDLVKSNQDNNYYEEISDNHIVYKYENSKPFRVYKDNNIWVIEGKEIEELFKMTRFTEDESVLRFSRKLKNMGIEEELEKLGCKYGDEVKILDYIFNFKE